MPCNIDPKLIQDSLTLTLIFDNESYFQANSCEYLVVIVLKRDNSLTISAERSSCEPQIEEAYYHPTSESFRA